MFTCDFLTTTQPMSVEFVTSALTMTTFASDLLVIDEEISRVGDSSCGTEDATNTLLDFRSAGGVVSACTNDTTHSHPTIQPEKSGQYRIATRLSNVKINGAAQGRVKVYVLDPSKPGVTSYATQRHLETAAPDKVWYQFSVIGDEFWEDNFSPNLRVTKVRFLQGKPTMDANTGRFKLDEIPGSTTLA